MQTQFTFEDWLKNKVWNQKNSRGEHVCNDSENYLYLVSTDQMNYDDINKIQNAQKETYEYIVKCSLELNEKFFKRKEPKSLDIKKVIQIQIDKLQKYLDLNSDIYYEIILPREHRGMKYGAKFIIPDQYLAYKEGKIIDINSLLHSPYMVNIKGKMVQFPTNEQIQYLVMEIKFRWQNILKSKLEDKLSLVGTTKDSICLEDIFYSSCFTLCKELFEDLEITLNGKCRLTPGKAGKLMGAIIAIKETHGMLKSTLTEQELLTVFNKYLGTSYNTVSKRSKGYKEAFDDAKRYLRNNFKK